jgi:hypothetical protein
MAKYQTVPVRPEVLDADQEVYVTLQAARDAEVRAENALAAAHDIAVAAGWEFHNSMLGFKAQVIAQYGDDSNEVQSLGIRKKSERKTPGRKRKVRSA